jgi:CheY-like chemotaxis protein
MFRSFQTGDVFWNLCQRTILHLNAKHILVIGKSASDSGLNFDQKDSFVTVYVKSIIENVNLYSNPFDLVIWDINISDNDELELMGNLLASNNRSTVFILANINKHAASTDIWKKLASHSTIYTTVDLFYAGILFTDKKDFKGQHHFFW